MLTFNSGIRPLRTRLLVNGKYEFVRFKAGFNYAVVPDDEWPRGEFPVSQTRLQMTESVYRTITGQPEPEVKPSVKKAKKKEAPKEDPPEMPFETVPGWEPTDE